MSAVDIETELLDIIFSFDEMQDVSIGNHPQIGCVVDMTEIYYGILGADVEI